MKEEVLSAYQQIRALSGQLRRREKLQQRKRQQQQQQQQQQQNMEEEEEEEADEDENEANCASSSSSSDEATTVASVKPGILKACVQVQKTLFLFLYIFVGKCCMFNFKKSRSFAASSTIFCVRSPRAPASPAGGTPTRGSGWR